jgi:hypothetical protein
MVAVLEGCTSNFLQWRQSGCLISKPESVVHCKGGQRSNKAVSGQCKDRCTSIFLLQLMKVWIWRSATPFGDERRRPNRQRFVVD